LNSLS